MSWPSTWADDIEAGRVDLTDAEVRAALVADLRGWRAVGDAMHRVAADVRAVGDLPMVTINADGVAPSALSLADFLWLQGVVLGAPITSESTP